MKWDLKALSEEAQPALKEAEEFVENANEILVKLKVPGKYEDEKRALLYDIDLIEENINTVTKELEKKIIDLYVVEMQNNKITNEILQQMLENMSLSEYKEMLWYEKYGEREEFEEAIDDARYMNKDEFLEKFGTIGYGIDQGLLENYFRYANGEKQTYEGYDELIDMVMNKYNMSEKDAAILIEGLDSIGACSYAALSQEIVSEFKDNPEEFERIFGFPMYKKNKQGQVVLNGEELLIDIYLYENTNDGVFWISDLDKYGRSKMVFPLFNDRGFWLDNSDKYGGSHNVSPLFYYDKTERCYKVNERRMSFDKHGNPVFEKQVYISTSDGYNEKAIEKYIDSKTSGYNVDTEIIVDQYKRPRKSLKKETLEEYIDDGYQISIGVYPTKDEPLSIDLNYETDAQYLSSIGGGHAMIITEVREDGLVVSTWGYRGFISYENLQNTDYVIRAINISDKSKRVIKK